MTLMPNWPHSSASDRVMLSTADLAAEACTWYHVAPYCSVALMLMMTADWDLDSVAKAARLIWKVPTASISITAGHGRGALGGRHCSLVAGKLACVMGDASVHPTGNNKRIHE